MKNKQILMGILASVLVFGLIFVGCDQATNGSTTKEEEQVTKFEGTWKHTDSDTGNTEDYVFKDNAFTLTMKEGSDTLVWQGTFAFNDTKITFTPTSVVPADIPGGTAPFERYYQFSEDGKKLWLAESLPISTAEKNAYIKQN
jgi:hypothetical protein